MPDMNPRAPWKDVTFVGGFWNCAERLEKLLAYARPWFRNMVVAVQESPDDTLKVAQQYADVVLEDKWHGRGDPSISLAAANVKTKYAFVVSDDEWPSADLLNSFQDLVNEMRAKGAEGAWVPFTSFIDGYDFTRGDQHLRFWEARIPWPPTPHARPMTDNTIIWKTGNIKHDRSLDEMVTDYLRRYDEAAQKPEWSEINKHNVHMLHTSTRAIAEKRGAEYVEAFEWFPRVLQIAWSEGEETWPPATRPEEEPPQANGAAVQPAAKRTRRRRKTA